MDPRQRAGPSRNGGPPPSDPRSGALSPGIPSGAMASPASPGSNMTRAERFEDEKRRIMDSCFAKVDANGQLSESYITHIRIQEDAAYPQSPPPPESPPANKKPRVVIIAVRNTGRVRLHKGRENANGTFSVGKTWDMGDLSVVESYSHAVPQTPEEAQHKQWAGDTGFTVTIQKPYYWNAGTGKEKEFFIASLIKIYRKYTQGKVPELRGFSPIEVEVILGPQPPQASQAAQQPRNTPPPVAAQQRSPPPRAGQPPPRPEQAGGPNRAQQPSPGMSPEPPFMQSRMPSGPGSRPPTSDSQRPPPLQQQRAPSAQGEAPLASPYGPRDPMRQPRPQPSRDRDLRQGPGRAPSREQMRPLEPLRAGSGQSAQSAGPLPPFAPQQRLTPQSSHSDFYSQRERPLTPETSSTSSGPPVMPPEQSPMRRRPMPPPPESNGQNGSYRPNGAPLASRPNWDQQGGRDITPGGRREQSPKAPAALRPGTAQSSSSSLVSRNEEAAEDPTRTRPPERRRPPMAGFDSGRDTNNNSREDVSNLGARPQPLKQAARSQESVPESLSIRMPGGFSPSPAGTPTEQPKPLEPRVPQRENQREPQTEPQPEPQKQLQLAPEPQTLEPAEAPAVRPPLPGEESEESKESYRPGLGPMVKKKSNKDVANAFRKAATAARAFQPRAGGAGARLLNKDETKSPTDADGITGVFKAPALLRTASEDVTTPTTPNDSAAGTPASEKPPVFPVSAAPAQAEVPEVTVSSPVAAAAAALENSRSPDPVTQQREVEQALSPDPSAAKATEAPERPKMKRRSLQHSTYLSKLGVDPGLLEGRGLDFEALLADFGWGSSIFHTKKIEVFEADVRRELGRVEAGSWLMHTEQKDDRVEAAEKLLDKAIAECDELEGLLTLYNVELGSLNDDIAFIEAQSQGLQVQTANQKLLQTELQSLLETITINAEQLRPLRGAPIAKPEGLEAIEEALLLLYKAMVTIDPTLQLNASAGIDDGSSKASGFGKSEISSMRALQEKRNMYAEESTMFLQRLRQYMDMTFGAALMNTQDALNRQKQSGKLNTKLDVGVHDLARTSLWQYSPLLLFAKEVDSTEWTALLQLYQQRASGLYQDEFRDNMQAWRKIARKPTGDEAELLFTNQEKEEQGMAGTARKLTVKRSQTLARSLRSASGEKSTPAERSQNGRLYPFEAFAGTLDEMTPLIFTEQNFIVDFFHASSFENTDFVEAVMTARPSERHGTNLFARKLFESDRAMAKQIVDVMDEIYSSWPNDLQNLVEWAIKSDPLQGIGLMLTIERKMAELEETNQDFLTRTLQKIHERLTGLFSRFLDEQIRAIEDTKVKIKKRKGVIAFMKTFPNFSAAIENTLQSNSEATERLEVRSLVDEAYNRINKAMFESLKVIAKESPTVGGIGGAGQGIGDPEDKEALNYHILLIENMNHFIEEVDERAPVLADWKTKARGEMDEHMQLYVDAVIRRPLGKLLEFIESTDALLAQLTPSQPATLISSRSSHSRSVYKKLLSSHSDTKELRRGIETLKKRIDKHFGDAEGDPGLSRNLVLKVQEECGKK